MRLVALIALAGCSFEHGLAGGAGDGGVTSDTAIMLDGPPGCTNHTLPPSVNVDVTMWSASFLTAPAWDCTAGGTTTINSANGTVTSTSCALGTPDVTNGVAQLTSGAPAVFVVRLKRLTVSNGHVVRLLGDKPVVLLVAGDVVVDTGGMIDASATAGIPGPGGSLASVCVNRAAGLGEPATGYGWGGGGGGFGSAGGQGCYDVINGGAASGDPALVPLRGGCSGGPGNGPAGSGQLTGAGGGAFEISAAGSISIGATGPANLVAAGGGGPAFNGGGNGGGSGGAILLVAPTVTFGAAGAARAHGGSGSEGSSGGGNDPGRDGHATDNTPATDISGIAGGGNNNDHGRAGGLAFKVGTGNVTMQAGAMTTAQIGGRGGGGGGGGRIAITIGTTTPACD